MTAAANAVDPLFVGKDPAVRDIYAEVLAALETLGPYQEGPQKTSIHLAADGLQTRLMECP